MPKLGFGLGLSTRGSSKKEFKGPVYFEDSFTATASLSYIERPIITTSNNYEESLTATANLTYTVSVA